MDAEMVSSVMSLIPERVAKAQTGTVFVPGSVACRFAERVAHVAKFLHWMSPLDILSNEDQQVLGLRNAAGRPVHAIDLEDEDLDGDFEQVESEQVDSEQVESEEIELKSEEEEAALA